MARLVWRISGAVIMAGAAAGLVFVSMLSRLGGYRAGLGDHLIMAAMGLGALGPIFLLGLHLAALRWTFGARADRATVAAMLASVALSVGVIYLTGDAEIAGTYLVVYLLVAAACAAGVLAGRLSKGVA